MDTLRSSLVAAGSVGSYDLVIFSCYNRQEIASMLRRVFQRSAWVHAPGSTQKKRVTRRARLQHTVHHKLVWRRRQ